MDIILLEDIDNLGYKDEIITVKNGYGRNYLIPQKKAILANSSTRKALEEKLRQQEQKYQKMLEEFNAQAKKIENSSVKVGAKVGTSGKIFGSVTTIQVADAIQQASSIAVDRKKIKIPSEIKKLGEYEAEVELHRDVKVTVSFEVIAE